MFKICASSESSGGCAKQTQMEDQYVKIAGEGQSPGFTKGIFQDQYF